MLRHRLQRLGVDVKVRSAGSLEGGQPAHNHGIDVLSAQGIDLSSHRSQSVTVQLLEQADLVLAMARQHVRDAAVLLPTAFPRTFTLKELIRRGNDVGPRQSGEPLDRWLARVHAGRSARDLMGDSSDDDIEDPIGRPRAAYERMVEEMATLLDQLVWLVWGNSERAEQAS